MILNTRRLSGASPSAHQAARYCKAGGHLSHPEKQPSYEGSSPALASLE
ncbi:hypothetical protein KBX73_03425 [Acetobacter persici]|nr:hypothetical protein [Acetobacter persici]MCP9318842.1 hypothetical protein [Acetobacter persici]